MFKKNDPLVEATQKVMQEGHLRRQVEKIVNEAFGVESRKALPNEKLYDYDKALAEATELALTEGLEKLDESFKDKLKAAGKFVAKSTIKNDKYVAAQNVPGKDADQHARRIKHVKALEESSLESIQEEIRNSILKKMDEAYKIDEATFDAYVSSLTEEQLELVSDQFNG